MTQAQLAARIECSEDTLSRFISGKTDKLGDENMLSQTGAEHAGEASKDGAYRVLTSSMQVLAPKEICTHSYICIGAYAEVATAENPLSYLQTKFVRFLILQAMSSIHLTKATFAFVPQQDFSKPWTDAELYAKYGLTEEEINFIEATIKPME